MDRSQTVRIRTFNIKRRRKVVGAGLGHLQKNSRVYSLTGGLHQLQKTVAYASRIMQLKPCVLLLVLLTIVPYTRGKLRLSCATIHALARLFILHCTAQCFGGIETYEKTPGMAFASVSNLQGLVSQPGTAVTRDCAALCRQTATCAAFTVGQSSDQTLPFSNSLLSYFVTCWLDYTTSRCQSIGTEDIKRREHLRDAAGVNYFEKICLRRGFIFFPR